jgi:hypothetical protein
VRKLAHTKAKEDAREAAAERRAVEARVVQRSVTTLEDQTLLWVHCGGFSW